MNSQQDKKLNELLEEFQEEFSAEFVEKTEGRESQQANETLQGNMTFLQDSGLQEVYLW